MTRILIGVLIALAALGTLGGAVVYAGLVDVAADSPHGPATYRLVEFARERAIERSSRDIQPPADLAEAERVRRGAGNYDAMCIGCHLAPGLENSEIRKGLYPTPPDLTRPPRERGDDERFAARQFWIIKHGIKASAMPAWAKGGMDDADIWDLVAFLRQLPALTPMQYRQLVEGSGGHRHGRNEIHREDRKAAKPRHDHSGHRHAH